MWFGGITLSQIDSDSVAIFMKSLSSLLLSILKNNVGEIQTREEREIRRSNAE